MDSKFKGGYSRMTNCGVTEHPEYSKGFYDGQQSKQAEIDKRLSDHQLEVSQVGQSCVKWKEIAKGKQAEIDVLKERIKVSLDWLEWSSSKNDSAVRRAISSLRGENNDT